MNDKIKHVENIGKYLSYLISDRFEEYAFDIIDSIAKARSKNELLDALYKGLRLSPKLKKKAKENNWSIYLPTPDDIRKLEEELRNANDEKKIRQIGLSLALWAFADWEVEM